MEETRIPDDLRPHESADITGAGLVDPVPTTENGHILSVSIVSPTNAPLFVRMFPPGPKSEQESPFGRPAPRQTYEVVYNALDVIEERLQTGTGKEGGREADGFVGCLAVFATTALYGSVTTNGYKLFIAVRGASENVDRVGGPMRTAFGRIGDVLVAGLLNPLQEMDQPLKGVKFQGAIADIVRWYASVVTTEKSSV